MNLENFDLSCYNLTDLYNGEIAEVAELADAHDSGSCGVTRAGSNPALGTKKSLRIQSPKKGSGYTDPDFLVGRKKICRFGGERLVEVKFYDYPVLCGKADEVRNHLIRLIEKGEKLFVVTLNSQIFLKAEQIPDYTEALKKASFHLPDGAGVVWAIKRHCNIDTDRIPGIDTMEYLCNESIKRGWSVYLLGAKPDVIKKAAEVLKSRGVKVVGYHHGYFEDQAPANEIRKLKPDLLFVGMGTPRQELWIYQHHNLPFKLAMGVGGSFDVISGVKKRAPKLFQKLRLEWFYRWLNEPIARARVPLDVMKFYFRVVRDGKNRNCEKIH